MKSSICRVLLVVLLCIIPTVLFSQDELLRKQIEYAMRGKNAIVGIAAVFDGKDTLVINGHYRYPTMSVYKFFLALAVLDHLDKNKLTLEEKILVTKSDMLPNTYSPLRDKHPNGGIKLTVGELLKYTISQSDNNACDILFRYVGGTAQVNQYIAGLDVGNIEVTATEEEMHRTFEDQYLNWTEVMAAAKAMNAFLSRKLFAPQFKKFLEQILIETTTGENKIKALLPKEVIVGHKTGSSFRNETGVMPAENDLGFIRVPGKGYYTLGIFVMNSFEDDETNAAMIAEISRFVYEYYVGDVEE